MKGMPVSALSSEFCIIQILERSGQLSFEQLSYDTFSGPVNKSKSNLDGFSTLPKIMETCIPTTGYVAGSHRFCMVMLVSEALSEGLNVLEKHVPGPQSPAPPPQTLCAQQFPLCSTPPPSQPFFNLWICHWSKYTIHMHMLDFFCIYYRVVKLRVVYV